MSKATDQCHYPWNPCEKKIITKRKTKKRQEGIPVTLSMEPLRNVLITKRKNEKKLGRHTSDIIHGTPAERLHTELVRDARQALRIPPSLISLHRYHMHHLKNQYKKKKVRLSGFHPALLHRYHMHHLHRPILHMQKRNPPLPLTPPYAYHPYAQKIIIRYDLGWIRLCRRMWIAFGWAGLNVLYVCVCLCACP